MEDQESKAKHKEPSSPTTPTYISHEKKGSFMDVIEEEKKSQLTKTYSKPTVLEPRNDRGSVVGATRRLSSVSGPSGTVPRKSFKALGGKVTSLVRAKMAFQRHTKKEEEEESDEILELPKEPRFSTSLSPEAQYAMMKGYEDAVYNYLCKSYPEYRALLKRNRTPVNPVEIKDTQTETTNKTDLKEADESNGNNMTSQEESTPRPKSDFEVTRRFSVDISRNPSPTRTTCTSPTAPRRYARANSLPNMTPTRKQLVMTHRLQSAMDILDKVKGDLGLHQISPRIKSSSREIKPVADYNKWTKSWNREFQTAAKSKG